MPFSILGCPHVHLSFPMVTHEGGASGKPDTVSTNPPQAHVTCLDCGREFWYDWQRMRRTTERPQPIYRRAA